VDRSLEEHLVDMRGLENMSKMSNSDKRRMQKLTFIHLDIIFNYLVFIVYPVVFALTVPKKKIKKKERSEPNSTSGTCSL